MPFISHLIEFIFSIALFINALLFIPQAIKIIKKKDAKEISLITFAGFLFIQFTTVLYALITHDQLLLAGYLLSMLTCGTVITLACIYRKPDDEIEMISFEEIIAQLPEHVYWKDKNGVYLGCNLKQAQSFGLSNSAEVIGKTDYDLADQASADFVTKIDAEVISTGKTITQEEPYLFLGKNCIMLSKKVPLKDENANIIGVLGISVDITHAKQEVEDRLKMLEDIIAVMPGHVYWVSKEGYYLGCNDNQAKSAGLSSRKEIIGKRNHDLPWNFNAGTLPEELDNVNQEVMGTGEIKLLEEPATLKDGSKVIFLSNKAPLHNSRGEITGMVGVSLDITDRKEKEKLEIETEVQKALLEEQRENLEIINKYAHDVRSPVSGAMMILNQCNELPENKRVPLRKALTQMSDMTKNLLSKYKHSSDSQLNEARQPVLVAEVLLDLLTEKRFEYQNQQIRFEHSFKNYFAFINIEPNAFKRSISNLVNNAVDAFEGAAGVVTLKLEVAKEKVKIIVQDNGKGMPREVVTKLMHAVEVTHDKQDGHGIGFKQIQQTLQENEGELKINSTLGKGSKMTLTFPKIVAPAWSVDQIVLGSEDILVILDDEESVKEAWRIHLAPILTANCGIEIHIFTIGTEALSFMQNLPAEQKRRVFLLTDFELINQPLDGLDVVEQSKVARSLLVTSHSAHAEIRERAMQLGTQILPKALAAEDIPIRIEQNFHYAPLVAEANLPATELKKVDIVIVDDDREFAHNLKNFVFMGKTVDCYQDPQEFLQQVSQYPKDTKICLDHHYAGNTHLNGFALAKQLHQLGYTHLYLLSGDEFKQGETPPYLTAILKTDLEQMQKI